VRPRPCAFAVGSGGLERLVIYTSTHLRRPHDPGVGVDSGPHAGGCDSRKAAWDHIDGKLQRSVVQRRPGRCRLRFKRTRVDLLALVRDGDQLRIPLFSMNTIKAGARCQEDCQQFRPRLAVTTLAPGRRSPQRVWRSEITRTASRVPASTPLMQAIPGRPEGVETWRARKRHSWNLVRINRNGSAMRRKYRLDYNREFHGQGTSAGGLATR